MYQIWQNSRNKYIYIYILWHYYAPYVIVTEYEQTMIVDSDNLIISEINWLRN